MLAIAGKDYCLVAGDTRHSEGYSINTRYHQKVKSLSASTAIAMAGMSADSHALFNQIVLKQKLFNFNHHKQLDTKSTAQLLSTLLYGKLFFPYSVWNIVGGLVDGIGAFTLMIGSFRRTRGIKYLLCSVHPLLRHYYHPWETQFPFLNPPYSYRQSQTL